MARVLAVSPENLELTVSPIDNSDKNIIVHINDKNDLPQFEGQSFLPECVVTGATIRLWGKDETEDNPFFLATDIRGCRKGGRSDPTGVRSRLRKIRKHSDSYIDENGEPTGNRSHGQGGHGNGGGNGGGGGGNR